MHVGFGALNPLKSLLVRCLESFANCVSCLLTVLTPPSLWPPQLHPWVTKHGEEPLPSEEEHCSVVEVTEEEVKNSVKLIPSWTTVVRERGVEVPCPGRVLGGCVHCLRLVLCLALLGGQRAPWLSSDTCSAGRLWKEVMLLSLVVGRLEAW
jgi:hypothetical protein